MKKQRLGDGAKLVLGIMMPMNKKYLIYLRQAKSGKILCYLEVQTYEKRGT